MAGTIAESLDLRDVVWLDATPFVAQPGASGSVHDEEVFDKVRVGGRVWRAYRPRLPPPGAARLDTHGQSPLVLAGAARP